jgi:hypothetical protein
VVDILVAIVHMDFLVDILVVVAILMLDVSNQFFHFLKKVLYHHDCKYQYLFDVIWIVIHFEFQSIE